MLPRTIRYSVFMIALSGVLAAQTIVSPELATFDRRLGEYVDLHRRIEGPIPPLASAPDMDEVHRRMAAVRDRIVTERKAQRQAQGYVLPPPVIQVLRGRIAGCLTADDIANAMADIDEHTPPGMPFPRVNSPLPEDAPFGLIPPQALCALPPLPPELRWVVLSNALLIWDHHADLVVDIAPGVFDAATYRVTRR
jgi:hypothetical protein